jgi:formamidopyrimidine-DNA glycosylase
MPELPEVETIKNQLGVPVGIDIKLERNGLRWARSIDPRS